MERGSTFFGIIGLIVQNSLSWIIRFGRKYQIVATAYLVIFFVSIIGYANLPVTPPTPATNPPSPSVPDPVPVPNPVPTFSLPPAIDIAQVKAYKNGNSLTLRFDKPVADVQLIIDEQALTADCKPFICTATVEQEAMQLQVSWSQGNESFRTNFRL
jgi:hypothetical protein